MARSVAYALLCLLVVAVRGSGGYGRIQRDAKSEKHAPWSYDEEATGPSKWPQLYKSCGGSEQSPINIVTNDLDEDEDLDEIDFDNYDDELKDATMDNNGHTVVVTPGANDPTLTITDGGLDDVYKLIEIHFHWGSDSKKGSEHTIDDKQYPMEMHLVHQNTKYKTKEAALKKDDGLAVLGVLFEIGDKDNDDFDPIVDKLSAVKDEVGAGVDIDDFKVEDLLPDEHMPYYRYQGSLTTPPCSEVVTWTIFEDTVSISEDQMQKFRTLMEDEPGETTAEKLVDNYRPVQNQHTRVVRKSVPSAARNTLPSASLTFEIFALAAFLTFYSCV